MKKQLRIKSLWLSLGSVMILGFFVLIAIGSYDDGGLQWEASTVATTEYLGDGVRKSTYTTGETARKTFIGAQDTQGRWDGPLIVEHATIPENLGLPTRITSVEKVNMVEGRRDGKSTTTYPSSYNRPDKEVCYKMGKVIDCQKSGTTSVERSAFQILDEEYPWFMNSFGPFGFENALIQAYMDTLERIILAMEKTDDEFINYYDRALDSLDQTAYDTIVEAHSILTIFTGLDETKNSEFRLAVLDFSRQEGSSTLDIIKTKYPGYLQYMSYGEVNEQDFELFCTDFDSLMNAYPPLAMEDPFFVDSVDFRMANSLSMIISSEEDTISSLKSAPDFKFSHVLGSIWRKAQSVLNPDEMNSTPSEVGFIVFFTIIEHFYQGDVIRLALEEAFNNHYSIISTPIVTTEFLGGSSNTSVDLNGYIHDDGGGIVTSSGITWAKHYNPTISDNTKTSGATTGNFTLTLEGLTEGDTYFVRTFATNSAGTAYGNCVEFIATSTVGVEAGEFDSEFKIYPNPTSAITTFRFWLESSENIVLTILNLKGQVAYQNDLGTLPRGVSQIELDLSDLKSGIYHSQLSVNGIGKVTRKIVVLH